MSVGAQNAVKKFRLKSLKMEQALDFLEHYRLSMKRNSLINFSLLILLLLNLISNANSNEYFVSETGIDSKYRGSRAEPLKTISFAMSVVPDGQHTIHLVSGEYSEQTGEKFPIQVKGGISIVSQNLGSVEVSAKFKSSAIFETKDSYATGITFRNIKIVGIDQDKVDAGIKATDGKIEIQNCHITGCFIGSYIENAESSIGNSIFRANSYGLFLAQSKENSTIFNSIFDQNRISAITCYKQSSPIIINNTITYNVGNGIFLESFSSPKIQNNIITANIGFGIFEQDETSDPEVSCNNIFANGEGNYVDEGKDTYKGIRELEKNVKECSSNIETPPDFVNAQELNYNLLPESSCIDKGCSDFQITPDSDIEGRNRPIGKTYDIGAYEFSHTLADTASNLQNEPITALEIIPEAVNQIDLLPTAIEPTLNQQTLIETPISEEKTLTELNYSLVPGMVGLLTADKQSYSDESFNIKETLINKGAYAAILQLPKENKILVSLPGNKRYYMTIENLEPIMLKAGFIKDHNVNLRDFPSIKGNSIYKLPKNVMINVVTLVDSWYLILTEDLQFGYVYENLVIFE